MRLMRASTFARRYFDEADRPDERTVRSWIERGSIVGRVVAVGSKTMVYVDAEAWETFTGNKLADRIMGAGR